MTAIAAASVNIRTMADGTLRVTFDVEPAQAGDAFALFGKPGTPAALAALAVGYAAAPSEASTQKPDKPGPLCMEAVDLCKNPAFWTWLSEEKREVMPGCTEAVAAVWIKEKCRVSSRRELDTSENAAIIFRALVRRPFWKWVRERATA